MTFWGHHRSRTQLSVLWSSSLWTEIENRSCKLFQSLIFEFRFIVSLHTEIKDFIKSQVENFKYTFTGYSFWDQLRNFLHKFTQMLFCQFISWTNWVNSGKFMENCWISCQVMADMENFYNNLIIINLYKSFVFSVLKWISPKMFTKVKILSTKIFTWETS